jgi:hypothetical protein
VHLTSRTRIVWAAVRSGEIGRYKLYGFNPGPNAVPQQVLLSEGCLAADFVQDSGATTLGLLHQLLRPRTLPRVPCSGTPRGDNATFYEPGPELSSSTRLPGRFSGTAGGSRWLSVFQAGSGNCAPDALGDSVHGDFGPFVCSASAELRGSGAGVGPEIPIEREFMIGRGQQKRQSARLLPTWIQSCQSHGGCEARG